MLRERQQLHRRLDAIGRKKSRPRVCKDRFERHRLVRRHSNGARANESTDGPVSGDAALGEKPDEEGDEASAHGHAGEQGALEGPAQAGHVRALKNDELEGDARLGRAGRGAAAEAVQQLGHAQGPLPHRGAEGGGLATVRGEGGRGGGGCEGQGERGRGGPWVVGATRQPTNAL